MLDFGRFLGTWESDNLTIKEQKLLETAPELLKACKLALKRLRVLKEVSNGNIVADAQIIINTLEDAITKVEGKKKNES